jgi:hypothetical protein
MMQLSNESQQEFTVALEQLANQVLVRLPERSLIEALNQALKLDCKVSNRITSVATGGKGWSLHEKVFANETKLWNWTTHILALWECWTPQKRLSVMEW